MIRHVVCWKLKDYAEGRTKHDNAIMIREQILALKDKINVIRDMEVGLDIRQHEANWDLILNSTFDNAKDLELYQIHPAHLEFKDFITNYRDLRAAIDYEF